MPVGIEVTAGTTATVAAMFVLGASSTAEGRTTAATVAALVLGIAAIAQARATAAGTGRLTAGVTAVAQARATAAAAGTLTLRVSGIAQSLARANAVATFILGLQATAQGGAALVDPGLVLATLTLRNVGATLRVRAPRAGLTVRPGVDANLRFQTDDPVP